MCGIVGIYNLNDEPIDKMLLEQMSDTLRHRGPDDERYYFSPQSTVHSPQIGLGNRRLKVIDLSEAGHQPMSNEEGSVWLTSNGRVYNYLELTEDLKSKGHIFKSKTDTEVIIHAYEEYGENCLEKFNGMFAFALWDERKQKLFCARDRFGIKPFYYYFDNKTFLFASEIKALLENKRITRKPNDKIIYDYLANGLVDHNEETFFVGIKQLLPAHYLVIEDGKLEIKRYWDLGGTTQRSSPTVGADGPVRLSKRDDTAVIPYGEVSSEAKEREYAEQFYVLLEDAVKLRLRSDVPVGTCLSGGLDSSSIVCIINKILSPKDARQRTFSFCCEDERYDERKFIQPVLDKTGVEGNFIFPDEERLWEIVPKVIKCQEEPFVSTSMIAQWYVMKLAKEKGVKVLLDGQGGDEILAGYLAFYGSFFADLFKSFQWRKLLWNINYYAQYHNCSRVSGVQRMLLYLVSDATKYRIKNLFGREGENYLNPDFVKANKTEREISQKYESRFNQHLYQVLTADVLPSLLHWEDRNSMAFSIEARVPFLDHRLVEFMFSLSPSQKIQDGMTKIVLRNAMKGILPEEVRLRTDKIAFATPEDIWFRTVLKDWIKEIIDSPSFTQRPYFNVEKIKEAFESYCRGAKISKWLIWRWVNLELWLRIFWN